MEKIQKARIEELPCLYRRMYNILWANSVNGLVPLNNARMIMGRTCCIPSELFYTVIGEMKELGFLQVEKLRWVRLNVQPSLKVAQRN